MCRRFKPLDDFPHNRCTKDGRATYCKPCHNQRMKETSERLYGGHTNFLLQRRYGVSADEVAEMVRRQGGTCAICRIKPAVHVDHDHVTGRVRGILCFACNRGLGKVGDVAGVLQAMLVYLRESSQ
jgi:hypothetical protein